jgi:Phage late control gene D protein (GPD).
MTESEPVTASAIINGGDSAVVIGGDEPPSTATTVEKNLLVKTQSTNTAGIQKATILDDVDAGAILQVQIQGEIVATGTVSKSEPGIGSRTRVTAFGLLHRLKQTFIDLSFDVISANVAIQRIAETAGVDVSIQTNPPLTETVSFSFKQKPADEAIDKLTKMTDTVTFVDEQDTLIVRNPRNVGRTFELENIINASAGSRRPQYQSVQVIGNTPTAARGRETRHLISSQPVLAEAGEGTPTYIFEDDSITTQQQAENTAALLLRRLKKQQQGGFVELVGRPDIRPFDSVIFPPAQGGSKFRVASVEHSITKANGYTTRLTLSGDII